MLCFRKRLGMEAGKTFLAASWSGHGFRCHRDGLRVGLHMSRERLRAQPRTIANNSNRRITISMKTLSLSLHFHASLIVCG